MKSLILTALTVASIASATLFDSPAMAGKVYSKSSRAIAPTRLPDMSIAERRNETATCQLKVIKSTAAMVQVADMLMEMAVSSGDEDVWIRTKLSKDRLIIEGTKEYNRC
jgi:hypothetical protein